MKKIVLMLMVVCISLAGCSLPFKGEETKPKEKKADVEEQISAPYVGYAKLNDKTDRILNTVAQSFPDGTELEILKYEAGENNKAIIRVEKFNKGKWETVQEQSLFLIHNVRNGYMVFNGDKTNGISVNTDGIRNDDKEMKNAIRFKPTVYASSKMFDKPKNSEGRMDLTEKKALMIGFEKEPIHESNGNIVPQNKGNPVDINDIYANKGNILENVGQGLTAVTIEFAYDEIIPKIPYFNRTDKGVMYASGLYSEAEVQLQKITTKHDTETGEEKAVWETVGEKKTFKMDKTGTMSIKGSGKDGKITIGFGEDKHTFEIPEEEGYKFKYEVNGLDKEYMSAKNTLVIKMIENAGKNWSENLDGEKDLKAIVESGKSADEAYKDTNLAESNNASVYALVLNVK